MHDMKKKFHVGLHFLHGMWYDVCVPLHVHFKWGVALVGEFIYWALFTPLWDPLSGTEGVQGDGAPTRP